LGPQKTKELTDKVHGKMGSRTFEKGEYDIYPKTMDSWTEERARYMDYRRTLGTAACRLRSARSAGY
jgi:hypothetical protein